MCFVVGIAAAWATLSAAPAPPSRACLHLNSGVWGSDVTCDDHAYVTNDGYILQVRKRKETETEI